MIQFMNIDANTNFVHSSREYTIEYTQACNIVYTYNYIGVNYYGVVLIVSSVKGYFGYIPLHLTGLAHIFSELI